MDLTDQEAETISLKRVDDWIKTRKSHDAIDHPSHYNGHPSGIECIEIVRWFNFNIGNAIKYIWRGGLKTSDPRDDYRKAIWYLNDEIKRIERELSQGNK